MNGETRIISPLEDILKTPSANFLAPNVPIPDTGTARPEIGGQIRSPLEDLMPKPSGTSIISPLATTQNQNLGELLLPRAPAVPAPEVPKPKPSLIGQLGKGIATGLYQLKEMGGGLTALAAEAIKMAVPVLEPLTEPVKEFGIETIGAARKGMEPYQAEVPSYKNIENVNTALQYLSFGVGTLFPMVAMSALTGGVGAATGKTLARNYLNTLVPALKARGISKEVINQTIKNGLIKGLERGAMLGGFGSSLGMEAGSITAQKVEEGQNIEPFRVMLGAVPAALLDVLPQFSLVQRTGILKRLGLSQAEINLAQETAKTSKAGLIGRIAKESGKQFMMEAPTEALQSVFENWAAHKDLTSAESIDDYIDSFLIGGAGGAFFGAFGGAFEKAGGKIEKREQPMTPASGEQPPTPGAATLPVKPPLLETPTAPGAPTLPGQALTTEQEYLQNIQKGRWLDFLAEKFNPPALSYLEEIQRNLGLIIHGNKVFKLDEKGDATPLIPEEENKAKLEITKRLEQFASPGEVAKAQNIFKFIGQPIPAEAKLLPIAEREGLPGTSTPAPTPEGAALWLGIGKKVSFEGKGGASQTGTVKDVVYGPPDGKTPMGVTVETATGKTLELKPDQVWEPRRLGRQREYRGEIATLPLEQRRQTIKDSKEFDRLIVQNADLFEEQGMIDMMDTRELLDQLRHDVGQRFGIDNPYSPVQRANSLPDLQDFMEKARPGSTEKIEVPKVKSFLTQTQPKAPGPTMPPAPIERPAPAPVIPAVAPAVAPVVEKIAAPVSIPVPSEKQSKEEKTRAYLHRMIGQRIKLSMAEAQGYDILATMEDQGRSPIDVSKEFWKTTYWKLDAEDQEKFKRQARAMTGLENNKDVDSVKLAEEYTEALPSKVEHLEDIERGYVSLMEWANLKLSDLTAKVPVIPAIPAAVPPVAPTVIAPEIKGAPVEENQKVKLQNEFLRIGDMGAVAAKDHFAALSDEDLRTMAVANAQPENIPRPDLEKRMVKYSTRAALNILHRAAIPEAPAKIIPPGLPEEHQKILLRPGESYPATIALRHINNSPDISPEDKMLGREILRNYRPETQNIPIKTLRPDMISRVPGSAAYYNTVTGDIWLDPELMKKKTPAQAARTIFHETIHGIIERNMTPADRAELLEMMRLAKNALSETERKILEDPNTDITGRFKTYLDQGLVEQSPQVYYGLSHPSEFFAQLSRPEFRDFLRAIPGIEKPVKRNLLERIIDWANRILFGPKDNHTLLSNLFEKMGEIGERISPEELQKWNDRNQMAQQTSDLKTLLPETRSILPEIAAANLENTDQYISHRAASNPDFMRWVKNKVGYGYITNKDLNVWEQNLSLPWHIRKRFPLYGLMVDDQLKREQNRSNGVVEFKEATNPFLNLQDGQELLKVERALSQGDKDNVVYDNDQLTNRFGLSDAGLEAYHSVRNTLNILLQRKVDHVETMLLRLYERTLSDVEFAQLQENYKKDLTAEEKAALEPTVVKIIDKLQKPINLLRKIRSDIQAFKGYFPREREKGAFYVSVWVTENDAQGNPHEVPAYFGFKNSQRETMDLVKELKAKYPDAKVNYGRWTQEPESAFFGLSDMNLMRFIDNAIEKLKSGRQIDEATQEGLRNALAQGVGEMLLARGAGAHQIHRNPRLIEGYKTTGLKEVLMNYITGYMGAETKQEAAFDFMDSLQTVPKDQPNLFEDMAHYASSMLRNFESMDRSMAKARAFAAIWYLGGSARSAVLNFTQNFVQGIPFLARIMKPLGKGPLAAERIYIKAMWDVAMGHGTDEEKLMVHGMVTSGIANDQQIRQISREMRGGTPGVIGNVMDILMAPFSLVEKFNRKSAALAAYRAYQELGLNGEELFQKTRDYVYDVHNLMTRANLPHAMRGGDLASQLLGTAYTFRRFNHNYILARIYSLRGPDGKISLKNSDVLIRSLAWFAVLGGMTALPFLDDILDELEKFFGRPFRTEMRNTLRQIGGEPLEQLGVAGIPAMLGQVLPVGVDMSGSLKIGLPSLSEPLKGVEETVTGVWGGLGKKTTQAYTQIGLGQYLRAFENASPIFIENILKAVRMSTEGATTPTGKPLFDVTGKPIMETGAEAAVQTLGFRPERISLMARTHREFGNVELNFSNRRNELYASFRLAKNAEERQSVIQDVQKYNLDAAKFKGVIPMINAQALRQAILVRPEKKYLLYGHQFVGQ